MKGLTPKPEAEQPTDDIAMLADLHAALGRLLDAGVSGTASVLVGQEFAYFDAVDLEVGEDEEGNEYVAIFTGDKL